MTDINVSVVIFIWVVVLILWLWFKRVEYVNSVRRDFKPFQHCRSASRRGYIYVFRGRHEDPRLIKIGHTKDLRGRLKAHRTANPHGIDLLAVIPAKDRIAAETYIHRRFADHRYDGAGGKEWFVRSRQLSSFYRVLNDEKLRARFQEVLG